MSQRTANIVEFNFDSLKNLPAWAKADTNQFDFKSLTAGVYTSYATLSIKGKVFAIVRDGVRRVITRNDGSGDPATSIEVIILAANHNVSKTYYAKGYDPTASAEQPTCFSNDGTKPDASVEKPQSKTCASCSKNVFGSATQGRGKACSDSRRIAIAPAGSPDDPMLLRLAYNSMKNLAALGQKLGSMGIDPRAIIMKLSFDSDSPVPVVQFTPLRLVDRHVAEQVKAVAEEPVVFSIIGTDDTAAQPKPRVQVQPQEVDPVIPTQEEDDEEDDEEIEELTDEQVAQIEAAKKASKPKSTPKPEPKEEAKEDKSELENALDALLGDFDD